MSHPYPIPVIARRAGLSNSTVDRVLNQRGGVRASTAAAVARAIADLDGEHRPPGMNGQVLRVDVIAAASSPWPADIAAHTDHELPADTRVRLVFHESTRTADLVAVLDRLPGRGPRGVILKVPDLPEVGRAIDRLHDAGIPVVTVATDVPLSSRTAYVGIDNRAAGATAAYLVDRWLGDDGDVLIAVDRTRIRGREEREIGFRSTMRSRNGRRTLIEATDTDGLDATVRNNVARILQVEPDIRAVYSIAGRNTAILDAFHAAGRPRPVFIGHNLNPENLNLLRTERISAALDHDLAQDICRALRVILSAHGAYKETAAPAASKIHIVTPFNIPPLPAAPTDQ